MQTKLTKTPTFFQFLTSIKTELPKIATSGMPDVYRKVSNPDPFAAAPGDTERHKGEPPNNLRGSMKIPLTRPLKTMILSPDSGPDVVETVTP
jgi:hypothetical protein